MSSKDSVILGEVAALVTEFTKGYLNILDGALVHVFSCSVSASVSISPYNVNYYFTKVSKAKMFLCPKCCGRLIKSTFKSCSLDCFPYREEVFQVEWDPNHETVLASSAGDRRLMVWDLNRYCIEFDIPLKLVYGIWCFNSL